MRIPCEHCGGTGYREVTGNELIKDGQVVGIVSGTKAIGNPLGFSFEEVLVRGDLTGALRFDPWTITITGIRETVGLEVTPQGARGPLWKEVVCEVVG